MEDHEAQKYLIVGILFLYLFPFFIARARNHHKKAAIFWLNLFLGWTAVIWIGLLIYSVLSSPYSYQEKLNGGFK
tara:strand:+ start:589 stop:813 length:225 start_codon:yes stop_codon:yes gene_type:complete